MQFQSLNKNILLTLQGCEDDKKEIKLKEEGIKMDGKVIEVLPNAMFRVEMPNKNIVMGYISGRMRKHDIKILLGDTVEVEFSPYDLTKGRITRRR